MTDISKMMMLCILLDMTTTNETDNPHEVAPQRHKQKKVKQHYVSRDNHELRRTPTKSYKTRK